MDVGARVGGDCESCMGSDGVVAVREDTKVSLFPWDL